MTLRPVKLPCASCAPMPQPIILIPHALLPGAPVAAGVDWYGDAANLSYITSDDAPFIIQQGKADSTFLKTDSKNLYNALVAAKVYAQLQIIANAGHKFAPSPAGSTTNPTYEGIAQSAVSFLNAKVKDNPNPLPQ